MCSKQKAFTLIELLVVIAIIGTLASVVLASLNSARTKARDAARIAQLKEIATAMQLFYSDNGFYPRENIEDTGVGVICRSCTGGINTVIANYMGGVPQDPSYNDSGTAGSWQSGDYYFYYDGRQSCGGNPTQAVLAAVSMENVNNSNYQSTICSSWGGEGSIGRNGSYMIVLGDSD